LITAHSLRLANAEPTALPAETLFKLIGRKSQAYTLAWPVCGTTMWSLMENPNPPFINSSIYGNCRQWKR
jgi:hypothetical protein